MMDYPVQMYVTLQKLGLALMNLEWIEGSAFCGVRNISELILNYNKLTSLPQLCPLKCCLVVLGIANNHISRLSKHFFKGFKKIRDINLNKNSLHVLPDLHWTQHSLFSLMADGNKIQSLDGLHTSGIYLELNYVEVPGNDIRNFNISILRHMPKLCSLGLHNNKLTHIDDFRSLYVQYISLGFNPWHCGVELSWMSDMSFKIRGPTCATPICRQGMDIMAMSK